MWPERTEYFKSLSNCIELNISVISPSDIAEKIVSYPKTTVIIFSFDKNEIKIEP